MGQRVINAGMWGIIVPGGLFVAYKVENYLFLSLMFVGLVWRLIEWLQQRNNSH